MTTTSRDCGPTRGVTVTLSMTSSAEADAEDWCGVYEFVVCAVLIGSFSVFGLVGNGASFVVLSRQRRTAAGAAAAVLLLQCMAVVDSLLLLVAAAVYVLPAVYPYTGHCLYSPAMLGLGLAGQVLALAVAGVVKLRYINTIIQLLGFNYDCPSLSSSSVTVRHC